MSSSAGPSMPSTVPQVGERAYELLGRIGYGVNGVLHLLVGALAIRVATDDTRKQADQSGALEVVEGQPLGKAVLWLFVVGFIGLALVSVAKVLGLEGDRGDREPKGRAKAAGQTVWYAALAALASSYARGRPENRSGRDFTARVFGWPAGQFIVFMVGLVIVAIGAYHVWKGFSKRFRKDLHQQDRAGKSGDALIRVSQFGYAAKGVALGIVGVLVMVGAVEYDPNDASGLDHALRTLSEQSAGPVLLVVIGIGFLAFGVFLLARMRRGRL